MTYVIATPLTSNLNQLTMQQRIFFGYLSDYQGGTRKIYEYHLNKFFDWCYSLQIDVLTAERTHMSMYVRYLSEVCGLRASTVNTAITPVKGFYKWAFVEGHIDRDPIVHVRLPKSDYQQKYPLERDDLRRFRRAAREIGGRHWAMGELLAVHALRISEACSVLIENCQDTERNHRVMRLRRKGGKWKSIPMPITVQMAIDDAAGDRLRGPIITRRDGQPISRSGGTGLVMTICRHAGIGKVNPHLIRGSVVTDTVEREGLREGQRLADHEDPRTTSRHYDLSKSNHDTHPAHIVSARLTG